MKKKLRPQGQDEEAFLEDLRSNVEFRHGLLPLNSSSSKGELASTTDKGRGPPGLINQWRTSHDLDGFKKPSTLQRGSRPHVLMEQGRRDESKLSVKRIDATQQDDAGSRAASMGHVTIKLKLPVRTCSDKEGRTEAAIAGNGIGQWSGMNSDSRGMVLDNDDDSCSDNLDEDSSSPNWQTENLKTEACDTTNYYLRHKVSQWHLKASRMEADISEPRFRQQYKRFPVLSGFNKGKRSCRRKLVGHLKRRLAILSGSLTYLTGKAKQGGKCALLLKSSVHDSYPQLQNDVPRRQPRKQQYWDSEQLTDSFGRTNKLMLACTSDGCYRDLKSQKWMGKFYMSSSSPSITSLQNSHSTKKDTGGKKENGFAAASVPAANAPSCQVQGCKNDLSSARDYYKRRKICEWHSKASKVNVDNIEQRFCQQCSRFQILSEFDEGRRSCRKMLAGHNERRRKPLSKSRVISRKARHGDSNTSKTLQVYVRRKKRFLDAPPSSQVEKSILEEMQLDED